MSEQVKTLAEIRETRVSLNVCRICHNDIHLMCRAGTGICSENCAKLAAGEKVHIHNTPIETEGHHASE